MPACSEATIRSRSDRSRRREHRKAKGETVGLIWFDAHGDMNTPRVDDSGNVHGMPLAALLGPEPTELSRIGGFTPKVRAERTVLVGIRNLDEREKKPIRDGGRARLHHEGHRPPRIAS